MLVIPGHSALSEFRREKILAQIHNVAACTSVEADHYYFADNVRPLDAEEKTVLAKLLNVESIEDGGGSENGGVVKFTVPRIGTISPWSSKAADILHLCGLESIRRVERGVRWAFFGFDEKAWESIRENIFDPMTESILTHREDGELLFRASAPAPLAVIDLLAGGADALASANEEFGFALSREEQRYLVDGYAKLGRNPTDVELMMFAQVNSEHCRHKIFNADWNIDGVDKDMSLFSMIRNTHNQNSRGTLCAYSDNAAVLEGSGGERFSADAATRLYGYRSEPIHFTAKAETHNHPTAISPFPGAATGCGGEIRDEGATGRGGKPKAGWVGYSVSHLRLPGHPQPWEDEENKPERIASPLQIMIEGPVGAAAFNNEFGRPGICGYFRSFEQLTDKPGERFGYHKPIMLAGGLGNIRPGHVDKKPIPDGTPIVVLGGPAMLIGLGGGAASSVSSGSSSESLDFASVQRGNPEMQRRCQEVIDTCCSMGGENPIISIHDVGAGGLSNALPELIHDSGAGGVFELRNILNDEPGMSPMQIWCNESQERYVLAVDKNRLETFENICRRERCLYAVAGAATSESRLKLTDSYRGGEAEQIQPVDLPLDTLFGLPPKMLRKAETVTQTYARFDGRGITINQACESVLSFPTVADKTFLVTIADRSVTGLVARDQMVGPWQVPVADVGVTCSGYRGKTGEAFAVGERTPIAVIDGPASAHMAIGEAVTNLAAARIDGISKIKLSANWAVAAGEEGHEARLYETVRSIGMELCPELGISIPVGKDSMSMKTTWRDNDGSEQKVVSPVSLIVSAFAPVSDTAKTLTPLLDTDKSGTELLLIDLGGGRNRMGGSILSQACSRICGEAPDLDDGDLLKGFFGFIQALSEESKILAYHDRSDGGLFTTLCEMAFASRCGLRINLDYCGGQPLEILFNEELGAVIQTAEKKRADILRTASKFGLRDHVFPLGRPVSEEWIEISKQKERIFSASRSECQEIWSKTSWQIQRIRDNPECADQEYQRIRAADPGLFCRLSFPHGKETGAEIRSSVNVHTARPKIAVLREQGVNGQLEMAAAFHGAGFEAVDVTTTDLVNGKALSEFLGLVACGGFSFGDVLGAGEGWGKSILFNHRLKRAFEKFFNRADTFALGVCNGCQMMSSIKHIIPGADHWPRFLRNASEQYESRFVMTEICSDKSILLRGMAGSMIPVSTAHGEGRAVFENEEDKKIMEKTNQICLRYVDNSGSPTTAYPYNPNGSHNGYTGFTNSDGRFTILMPHPERVLRTVSNSWHPEHWGEYSPWVRLFRNARDWVAC